MAQLPWPLPPELDDDAALTALLFPGEGKAAAERPEPDWARIHAELEKKGVPKQQGHEDVLTPCMGVDFWSTSPPGSTTHWQA
ncbi:MAG TPA: hypothetical protein VFZ09_37445 [Archangium sp.]|uniref:hypothetical protein n=1 Tax=Archangium sp. TaxID=1872627 RepID=UPI002E3634B0|nr:hypothetical protein [Archangium sp.]HEX5751967.1 hypothetical protein [Archangium sp.]